MIKISSNLLQTFTKSTICLNLTLIISLITICPQQSIQQDIISKSSAIQASCNYNYSSSNIYTCDIYITESVNLMDYLEITGVHLENHTDADVQAVYYSIEAPGYFGGEVLRKFVNLNSFFIAGRGLTHIHLDAFDVCPKLEKLTIYDGQLTSFSSGMLKNCEHLTMFEMMGQKVETFPEDFFGNTQNLEEFVVSVNRLTSLPEKLLQNMINLKKIRFGFNQLRELSPNFFINAPNLEEVSAYNNEFQDPADITFALNGRINLKYLSIEDNNFTSFDFRFFAQFQKLEYLSVGMSSGPKLSEIHWQSLPASLTDLIVKGIGENIPGDAFNRVTNLTSLTLYGEDITNLHKDTFKPLTSLVFLYLYYPGLKTLHPELFTNQINLSSLTIQGSQLEELPPGIFAPLVNIGIRNVYNNIRITSSKIRRLNANSFGMHPHLQNIDFSNNDINEIERGIFSKFHPNMTFAGFNYNECVSKNFEGENLDNHKDLELCYKNWEEIDPNNTTIAPISTTPAGSGRNYNKFEVFVIIFVGIFKMLSDQF